MLDPDKDASNVGLGTGIASALLVGLGSSVFGAIIAGAIALAVLAGYGIFKTVVYLYDPKNRDKVKAFWKVSSRVLLAAAGSAIVLLNALPPIMEKLNRKAVGNKSQVTFSKNPDGIIGFQELLSNKNKDRLASDTKERTFIDGLQEKYIINAPKTIWKFLTNNQLYIFSKHHNKEVFVPAYVKELGRDAVQAYARIENMCTDSFAGISVVNRSIIDKAEACKNVFEVTIKPSVPSRDSSKPFGIMTFVIGGEEKERFIYFYDRETNKLCDTNLNSEEQFNAFFKAVVRGSISEVAPSKGSAAEEPVVSKGSKDKGLQPKKIPAKVNPLIQSNRYLPLRQQQRIASISHSRNSRHYALRTPSSRHLVCV